MLAGVLKGWASPAILDAHEAERWPITEQVSRYAMGTAMALAKARRGVPAEIERTGPEGDAVRAAFVRELAALNTPQFCCAGLNFGYFYDRSPLIVQDGEAPPGYTMDGYTPSTVPGCRLPHVWVDGVSLYDRLGPDFTLLRLDAGADADPILRAARAQGMSMQMMDVAINALAYRHKMMLVRPDQHVAWRGDVPPADSMRLIARIRGADVQF